MATSQETLFVGGGWVPPSSTATIEVRNASTVSPIIGGLTPVGTLRYMVSLLATAPVEEETSRFLGGDLVLRHEPIGAGGTRDRVPLGCAFSGRERQRVPSGAPRDPKCPR
jgi:hypothetical protein